MKYCTKCGKGLGVEDIFCSSCGTKVNGDTENIGQDKSIKADLKVEVTNATTEKAFKKVGETISSGKEAVKVTTGFTKKIIIPFIIIVVVISAFGIGMAKYYDYSDAKAALDARSYKGVVVANPYGVVDVSKVSTEDLASSSFKVDSNGDVRLVK